MTLIGRFVFSSFQLRYVNCFCGLLDGQTPIRTRRVHPGYVDDQKRSRDRVALAHEEIESYDSSDDEPELVRAVQSPPSPLGWDRSKIRRELAETRVAKLSATAEPGF
jgi:hypothetical protein